MLLAGKLSGQNFLQHQIHNNVHISHLIWLSYCILLAEFIQSVQFPKAVQATKVLRIVET